MIPRQSRFRVSWRVVHLCMHLVHQNCCYSFTSRFIGWAARASPSNLVHQLLFPKLHDECCLRSLKAHPGPIFKLDTDDVWAASRMKSGPCNICLHCHERSHCLFKITSRVSSQVSTGVPFSRQYRSLRLLTWNAEIVSPQRI